MARLLSQCQSEAAKPCPWLPWLPPGEERLPALEALRVGLAGGALVGTRRFHNHRRHLNQVQGALPILQRLSQVQDLAPHDCNLLVKLSPVKAGVFLEELIQIFLQVLDKVGV